MNRIPIRVPSRPRISTIEIVFWKLVGAILTPIYLLLAWFYHAPGLGFRRKCAELGFRLVFHRHASLRYVTLFDMIFMPMDSTRYFEFEFAWRVLSDVFCQNYLDVSSPRLFPLIFSLHRLPVSVHLVNPNKKDLTETATLANAMRLNCVLHDCLITDAPFASRSFDVITCLSVLEHIPDDESAIKTMWDLLKPGGKLVLTVPCMARAAEQYIDQNEYGILQPDDNGFVFWQRFYDAQRLHEKIFTTCGKPVVSEVYGEKQAGSFFKNAEAKRANPDRYAFWREPYMMAREYILFDSVGDLPGEGVIAMEFVKP